MGGLGPGTESPLPPFWVGPSKPTKLHVQACGCVLSRCRGDGGVRGCQIMQMWRLGWRSMRVGGCA